MAQLLLVAEFMRYNYFKPGKMFYLNGLGFGTTSVGIKNGALSVKCDNPIAGLALKAQIEKLLGNVNPSFENLKEAIESVSDYDMKARLARGSINDIKRAMSSR
tara:strand:+ start:3128 stop:3439 length:312 start_codon:yes stop_codon:yes gene_type:complete